MMKRSHFLIGAAAGALAADVLDESLVLGVLVAGLAALLPDADHPGSVTGQLLPGWWHRLTPGHRGPTHSLAWCGLLAGLAYAIQGLFSAGPVGPVVAVLIGVGALSHVAADGLTTQGVPLWWPFRRRKVVLLGGLAFRTHSWPEVLVTLTVVSGAAWLVVRS
ncbi:MAG TPA: metal-dependent hydrolase [Actinomycetes bacterium]|nr:metal-dependent hydrolase [Actinomycetes bacterium]